MSLRSLSANCGMSFIHRELQIRIHQRHLQKHTYKKTYHHWDDDWGREGGVLRCDPMGSNLEIVSRGLRNPWDMTMDDGFQLSGLRQ